LKYFCANKSIKQVVNYHLAIESSCDETSASVCEDGRILNVIANQTIFEQYGGVVPELSRAHLQYYSCCGCSLKQIQEKLTTHHSPTILMPSHLHRPRVD
jgi:tRNA A37 threonylcarbamoyltransferase TsaD